MQQVQKLKRKRERIYFRISKGCLVPADECAASQLRDRHYRVGDVVSAEITKLRNPKFNRLVHRIGKLVTSNIEAFSGLDAHMAIKRLQMEGRIQCDEIGIFVPGYGMVIQVFPRSLSFETTDETEFHDAAKRICRIISERYWTELSPEAIMEMSEAFVDE